MYYLYKRDNTLGVWKNVTSEFLEFENVLIVISGDDEKVLALAAMEVL